MSGDGASTALAAKHEEIKSIKAKIASIKLLKGDPDMDAETLDKLLRSHTEALVEAICEFKSLGGDEALIRPAPAQTSRSKRLKADARSKSKGALLVTPSPGAFLAVSDAEAAAAASIDGMEGDFDNDDEDEGDAENLLVTPGSSSTSKDARRGAQVRKRYSLAFKLRLIDSVRALEAKNVKNAQTRIAEEAKVNKALICKWLQSEQQLRLLVAAKQTSKKKSRQHKTPKSAPAASKAPLTDPKDVTH